MRPLSEVVEFLNGVRRLHETGIYDRLAENSQAQIVAMVAMVDWLVGGTLGPLFVGGDPNPIPALIEKMRAV